MKKIDAEKNLDTEIRSGTLTLAGYGIRVRVARGHLAVEDGAGRARRSARFPRVATKLERVVVVGTAGSVTLDALQWMQDTGVAFVHLDHDANLVATSAPNERRHGEWIRAQALAPHNGAALEIARALVEAKLTGQRSVLERLPDTENAQDQLERLIEGCGEATDGEELLTIEGYAANTYWSAWESVPVSFQKPDRERVPDHWQTVGSRGSPYSKNAQHAVTPVHAMLNYLYAILRAETRLAIAAMGMEPSLGIYHATKRWRDSFTFDLMEPVRPLVDDYVFDLLEERTFEKSAFFENRRGVVRVLPPLAEELSASASKWREAVAPRVEQVTQELMAWADEGSRGALTRRDGNTAEGGLVPTRLTKDRYKSDRQQMKQHQAESARESWEANQAWDASNEKDDLPEIDYEEEILPWLEHVRYREIAEATGLSMTYAGAIRRGREVPHRRHWPVLLELAQKGEERAEVEDRWEDVDFEDDILLHLESYEHQEIAEAVGLSRRYVTQIMNGKRVPSREHWEGFAELAGK